jgi:hypothetical protein
LVRKGTPPPNPDGGAETALPEEAAVVIAIEPVAWEDANLPAGAKIIKIPFRALTKPLLNETGASIIIGTLWSPEQDAMAISERLGELDYRGKLLLLGPALPNPSLVAREIRSASGSKDFTVELKAVT